MLHRFKQLLIDPSNVFTHPRSQPPTYIDTLSDLHLTGLSVTADPHEQSLRASLSNLMAQNTETLLENGNWT